VKDYYINLTNRQILSPEDGYAKSMAGGGKHGISRGFSIYVKRSLANDPYSLRRRLLRTVLKRIALIAVLCLPPTIATHFVGHHWQSSFMQQQSQFIRTITK
jgi:hypothetical protein